MGLSSAKSVKHTNATNERMNTANNQANKDLAEYAHQKNLDMWNLTNEYNSPESQMERYSDAGLNPNLIYGQGSNGNAGNIPAYQAPKQERHQDEPIDLEIGQMIQSFQNMRLGNAQIDNLEADKQIKQTQAAMDLLNYKGSKSDYHTERETKKAGLELIKTQTNASQELTRQNKQQFILNQNKDARDAQDQTLRTEEATRETERHSWEKDQYNQLRKNGVFPGDPLWYRLVQQIKNRKPKENSNEFKKYFDNLIN